jgi:hypothetical protein
VAYSLVDQYGDPLRRTCSIFKVRDRRENVVYLPDAGLAALDLVELTTRHWRRRTCSTASAAHAACTRR